MLFVKIQSINKDKANLLLYKKNLKVRNLKSETNPNDQNPNIQTK